MNSFRDEVCKELGITNDQLDGNDFKRRMRNFVRAEYDDGNIPDDVLDTALAVVGITGMLGQLPPEHIATMIVTAMAAAVSETRFPNADFMRICAIAMRAVVTLTNED